MATSSRGNRVYQVAVSFDGLNKGERFRQPADDWSKRNVDTGYLLDVTDEPAASAAQVGAEPTQASDDQVQGAKNAGEVGKG